MDLSGHRAGIALAALYAEAGCEVSAQTVRKHRKIYGEMRRKIGCVLKKAVCIQMRGMVPGKHTKYSDFHRFEVVETLVLSPLVTKDTPGIPAQTNLSEDNEVCRDSCPLCGVAILGDMLETHMREELLGRGSKTRVLIDRAFGIAQREISLHSENARELKTRIFTELGISVSKQDIFLGERLLGNRDSAGSTDVHLRLKKRYRPFPGE